MSKERSSVKKKIGVIPIVSARPLVYGLGDAGSSFELEFAHQSSIAAKMRQGSLDVAFLSPIDYALNSSDYSIVPGIGVSSATANRSLLLAFKQGLRRIERVAISNVSTSEVLIARFILAENYEVNPTFVPIPPRPSLTVETMLTRADAALIAGDESALKGDSIKSAFDLTEEWQTLSNLPFVHGFWVVRHNMLTKNELRALRESKERGVSELEVIATETADRFGVAVERVAEYLATLVFDLDEEDVKSLREFFRMAFYHGVIGEVPELKFLQIEPKPDPLSN